MTREALRVPYGSSSFLICDDNSSRKKVTSVGPFLGSSRVFLINSGLLNRMTKRREGLTQPMIPRFIKHLVLTLIRATCDPPSVSAWFLLHTRRIVRLCDFTRDFENINTTRQRNNSLLEVAIQQE